MIPRTEAISSQPEPGTGATNLVVKADSILWLSLIGTHLNIIAQAYGSYTTGEDWVDFIASDLRKGIGE